MNARITIFPKPSAFTNHETDDHGFPLCSCEACREKSKIINAQYIARMFGGIFDQFKSKNTMGEVEHDGDLGREWLDQQDRSGE